MGGDPALAAYEAFAVIYNEFNSANDYERWLGGALLPELRKHGLREAGQALDVGCGTGRAFQPLLSRGWKVHGCDLSPAMLKCAGEEGHDVPLVVADMRSLPIFGDFDLVLSLNDSLNYLLGDDDLVRALEGMRRNLAAGGLIVFDVNSRSTYSGGYSGTRSVEHKDSRWVWTGRGEVSPSIYESEIAGDRLSRPIRHLERFRPANEVLEAMQTAGIECVAALGMREIGERICLSQPFNEARDYKLVFLGTAAPSQQT